MKKIIPIILLSQILLILLVFFIIKKKRGKLCFDNRDERFSYYDPAYKKYFEKRWKKEAEKLAKEMKQEGTYYTK